MPCGSLFGRIGAHFDVSQMMKHGITIQFQTFHSIKAIGNREVLQALLREHPERKFRLIGSGLSFEPIHSVYAEGSQALLVDLHHLRGQLATTADTVTYQAGTPLDTVYAELIAMERMLPASPGVIGIQTLGGALSTGTHGEGLHQSALCDAVEAMTVMLASGEIIRVDRTDPRFGAFVMVMGMGMLGILLDVTLRTGLHHAPHQIHHRLPLPAGAQRAAQPRARLREELVVRLGR